MTTSLSALILFTLFLQQPNQVTITVRVMTATSPPSAVGEGYQVLIRDSSESELIIAGGYTNVRGDVPLSLNRNTGRIWIEVIQKGVAGRTPDRSEGKQFSLPLVGDRATYLLRRQLTSVTLRYRRVGRLVPVWYVNPWTCTRFYRMKYIQCYEPIIPTSPKRTPGSGRVESGTDLTSNRTDELDRIFTSRSRIKFSRIPLLRTPKKLKSVDRKIVGIGDLTHVPSRPLASIDRSASVKKAGDTRP